ncbi:MAG: hypothetical protein AMXMBFR47_14350 [Planctomycetota bacterium]
MTGPYVKRGVLVRVVYLVVSTVVLLAQRLVGIRPGTIVLCYHAVTRSQRPRFERQMHLVARCPRPVASDSASGSSTSQAILVTFDDAFDCLRESAFPVMRELGIPATVFVVSGNLGSAPKWSMPPGHPEAGLVTMDRAAIAALRGDPLIQFGSHTVTHPRLAEIEPALAESELAVSKRELEALTGRPVDFLALPHGSISPFVAGAARRAGYRAVFTLEPAVVHGVPADGLIGRFGVSPDMWMAEFRLTIAGAYAWLGPWRRFLRRLRALVSGSAVRGRLAVRASQS